MNVKPVSVKQVLLLVLCAAVLTYCLVQVNGVGDHLQYVLAAPTPAEATGTENPPPPNQAIVQLQKQLADQADEWAETMLLWSMDGAVEEITYTSADAASLTATGRLTLYGQYGQQLHPSLLRHGRLMYPEELEKGAKVILLDEALAIALFRVGDPIDREVIVGEDKYQVIGVVAHSKQVGDSRDYGAYIPLNSVISSALPLDILVVEAAPRKGVGASTSFKSVVTAWNSKGTLVDLNKEATGAWLWLRVLGFVLGSALLLRLIGRLNRDVGHFVSVYRAKLQRTYAIRLMPWATGRVLLFLLGYGVAALVFAMLMNFMLAPVYVFPEWIPTVLVEWSDINDTFWKVWQGFATAREYRTPELIRIRFYTLLIDGFAALSGFLLSGILAKSVSREQRMVHGLKALYHQGVMETMVVTDQPLWFEKMGYVPTSERQGQVTLHRIVHVERLLTTLPPSKREGSFVLEVLDDQLTENQTRWKIVCDGEKNSIRETEAPWDLQLTVKALTSLVDTDQTFQEFSETAEGFDLRLRSPAMDGLFGAKKERTPYSHFC